MVVKICIFICTISGFLSGFSFRGLIDKENKE